MRKPVAILGSAIFFAVVPCAIAGIVQWWITHWRFHDPFLATWVTQAFGVILIVAGLPGLIDSIRWFAVEGFGTPAPVAPMQTLVAGVLPPRAQSNIPLGTGDHCGTRIAIQ
jgi:hypothetical protein